MTIVQHRPDSPSGSGGPSSGPLIATPDQRLRVFVSSTLRELSAERDAARRAIAQLQLIPVMFELGARPHPPRALYRAYLDQSHVFVGIYWQSYGWVAPGAEFSGLEDEYRLAANLPKLIYIKSRATEREPRLDGLLDRIRRSGDVSYKYFETADELRELLKADLAVVLSERFIQAAEGTLDDASGAAEEGGWAALVPAPLSSLVGRRSEIEELEALLARRDVRLVTLTGPGGVGKTRLALAVAASVEERFADGLRWVDLADIRDPSGVIRAVARSLGVGKRAGVRLEESVSALLQDRSLLLLLDNFEQVASASQSLVELLERVRSLKILVTSRTRLRLRGEYEYEVQPLAARSPSAAGDEAALDRAPAAELFVQRAKRARPDFAVDQDSLVVVAEIAQHLDGLPLAIELAAARMRVLSLAGIRDLLADRLALLRGGAQDLPPRQQTMRNVMDWSYDLLDADAQALFGRLSVFAGGFAADVAQAVCGDSRLDTVETIASLLDCSLLRNVPGAVDQPRFGMLETVREYAAHRLAQSGETAQFKERHAAYFAELAERAEGHLYSSAGEEWLDRLATTYGNLRAAIEWGRESLHSKADALRILLDLIWFWYRRGYLSEASQLYGWAIQATADGEDDVLRARVLSNAGFIAMWLSDLAGAAQLMDRGLQALRGAGDRLHLMQGLFGRGVLAVNQRDVETAARMLAQARTLAEELDLPWFQAIIPLHLANVALAIGDPGAADAHLRDCEARARSVGDPWNVASALNNLGELARYRGEHNAAEPFYVQSRELFQRIESQADVARADHSLGWVALRRGDPHRARDLFRTALAMYSRLGVRRGMLESIAGLAAVHAAEGDPYDAARLVGFVESRFADWQVGVWPADEAEYERTKAALRKATSESEFKAVLERGVSMSLPEVIGEMTSH